VYPAPASFAATEEPVKIGMIDPMTGTYAALGDSEIAGARMAVDEINARGGILGRPVQIFVEDSAADPGQAVQKARKLVGQQKVNYLMGSVSSAVSLSLNQTAAAMGVLYMDTGGHTDDVTGSQCHWTTFRICSTTWMLAAGNFHTLFEKFGKRWYFITPDYAYGHSVQQDYAMQLEKAGGTVVGNALAPVGSTDFTSYLIGAKAANPSVLLLLTGGDDTVNCLKQVTQFGLEKSMPIAGPLLELEVLAALPEPAHLGWWGFEWYWNQPDQPHLKAFIDTYRKRVSGKYPSARSWFGYAGTHAIALAAERAKSLESLKVARALEGMELPPEVALQPNHPAFDPRDHQLIASSFQGQVKPKGIYPDLFEVAEIVPGSKIAKPAAESGCRMSYPS
jgi:branched-chain amino acid transport system substrate-binding protein